MSSETLGWLNKHVLIGFTDQRGKAWHWMASEQGEESNHYPGAIPPEKVLERLFNFDAVKVPIEYTVPERMDLTGVTPAKAMTAVEHTAVINGNTGHLFGVFGKDYEPHQYGDVLITNLRENLGVGIGDGGLQIGSAGLLHNGGRAWVSLEAENVKTAEGVEFRPHLLAFTSHDGSLSSGFKFVNTLVVCDNTLTAALSEVGTSFKVKHTKNSQPRLRKAGDALGILAAKTEQFEKDIKRLCEIEVTDKMWSDFLQAHVPTEGKDKRGLTLAENKRGTLTRLWSSDERVEPWKGTAFGVFQAMNTFHTHEATTRGATSQERKWDNVLGDRLAALDNAAMADLNKVLASV